MRDAQRAVRRMAYKARVRSSREMSDTALKKGLGGIPLWLMNAATSGCNFDKWAGMTQERSLGGEFEIR